MRSGKGKQEMSNLLDQTYTVIYADPPWRYNDKGFGKRPKDQSIKGSFAPECGRYGTLSQYDIISMGGWVSSLCDDDCALFLWATSPLLPEALEVMRAWGFKYKTVAFCWSKITTNGKEVANLGQWTMGNIELCLLGTKGRPKRVSRCVRQLVVAERTEHSKKPSEVQNRIVDIFGDVPRIELFARNKVEGWDAWGNEID